MNETKQIEAELLGAILNYPEFYPRIRRKLRPEFFQDEFHRRVFSGFENLAERGVRISVTNLMALGCFDGEAHLLTSLDGSAGDIGFLCQRLSEEHVRSLLRQGMKSISLEDDPLEAFQKLEATIESCHSAIETQREENMVDVLDSFADYLHRNAEGGEERIRTGFPLTDSLLEGGLSFGDLSILGGIPGSGKSSFLLHIALSAARQGIGVAFMEAEMTREQILTRMNAISEGIPTREIRRGTRFAEVSQPFLSKLFSMPLHLVECTERNLFELKSKIDYYATVKKCRLVCVDYLQVFAESRKDENEYEAVSRVSRELRRLALKYKIHILAASSLNRLHVARGEKPGLQSLRSSGQLGHDRAVAMFLIGEEKDEAELIGKEREVELHIAKNRDGARGVIRLNYRLDTQQMFEQVSASGKNSEKDNIFEEASDESPF